jgi:arylsulfatase A-like enzyme
MKTGDRIIYRILGVTLLVLLISAARAFPNKTQNADKENEKPNVIIVLSDDQGYGDFSCHGNPILSTPNLDKLYEESVRFTDFHVTPLCTPTRGELLTGVDAMRNGAATVLTARNIIRRHLVTMPEIFRSNGYTTGIFGKWHLGDTYPDRPMDRGFDKSIWHKGWGLLSEIEYDNDYYETRYLDSLTEMQSAQYCTNLWFDEAMDWMDQMNRRNKPFFTYLSLNAPHGPFDAQMQDFEVFRNQVEEEQVASFLGMVRNIDRSMGRLMQWLKSSALEKNTILIFMNDNGGTRGVEVFNAGMRDKKGSIYEGGHRAACFIRWPEGGFTSNRSIPYAAQVQDILPTLADLLQLDTPADADFDGRSLRDVIFGEEGPDRMFVVQYGGHVAPKKYEASVVWNQCRMVGGSELYDISKDPGQKNDIAAAYPEVFQKMKAFYDEWWNGVEGSVDDFVPLVVGEEEENPVIFHSANWEDNAVNTQWKIAVGGGEPRGGTTHIRIASGGRYKIQLSRWPFHLDQPLRGEGPEFAVGGTAIRKGKPLPVYFGSLSIDGAEPRTLPAKTKDKYIEFTLPLSAGRHEMQAWFRDENNRDLIGAYYVRMEKL